MIGTANPPLRWLMVHELHDRSALWLAEQWRQRLGSRAGELLVLPAPELARSGRLQLRRDGGEIQSRLSATLDGRVVHIDSTQLRGVLHRPFGAWTREPGADDGNDALTTDQQVLLQAWLHGLGERCINKPAADSLAGPVWAGAQWRWLAHRLRLPVRPWPEAPLQACLPMLRLLVVGDRCFNVNGAPLPTAWHSSARRVAAAAQCRLLGLYFVDDGELGWRFVQAGVQPDLRCAGHAAAQALAAAMHMPEAERLCA